MHFKSGLSLIVNHLRHQSVRHYRFGTKVTKGGYFVSTEELHKKHLKSDHRETDDIRLDAEELRRIRNKLFDDEKRRQKELVTRVEKITVSVIDPFGRDPDEKMNLMMNKDMSTPYDCSLHINQLVAKRSALALIDDKHFWDMHRPLTSDCTLRFKHFKEPNPHFANRTHWKSCSLVMGSVIERAFKDTIDLKLHSWPKCDVASGSFVYDVFIDLKSWTPNAEELRVFTSMFQKLVSEEIRFERLDVNKDLAKKMFEHNHFKRGQIDSITSFKNTDSVTVYRVKDHIDISSGPMIADTSQVGSVYVTAVHRLAADLGPIYRFQGIAIPKQLNINSYVLSILRERAHKLNLSESLASNEHDLLEEHHGDADKHSN